MTAKVNLRVCLLTETYYPVVGGGETQARALSEGLAKQGFTVTVVTRRSGTELPRNERVDAATVYRLPPTGPAHWKKWGLLLSTWPLLFRLRRKYDLLYVSGFRLLGIPAVLAGRLLGKPVVLKADSLGEMSGDFFAAGLARLHLRPSSLPFRFFLGLRNLLLRRADRFVAIAPAIGDELQAHGVPAEKIEAIPNSVDTSRFHAVDEPQKAALRRQLELSQEAKVVIFTGRLVSYKGLPLLLRVWKEIQARHRQALLLLVGSGGLDIHNCEDELRRYVAANGLESTVRFTGNVRNVHDYLQAADIFAFPTESEAFGISLVEAMACGLAVVTTAVGGVRDIVSHGENGLVVDAGDHDQLYEALDALLLDERLACHLGAAAAQTGHSRYAAQHINALYATLFCEMVQSRNKGN
jgi:glycosyltransferase involved in cell wall biosynthesis